MKFLKNDSETILSKDYSKSFLDDINDNINNILDKTIIFKKNIENFESEISKEIIKEQEKREKEMKEILDERNRKLSNYSNKHKNLLNKTVSFINATDKNNKYSGKNIKFKNGIIGYVTEKGYFKYYPNSNIFNNTAGLNNCPSNIEEIDIYFYDYKKQGTVIPTDPPLIVGSPMTKGQTCGNEGQNIQVTTISNNDSPYSLQGCYSSKPEYKTKLEYQNDLGNATSFSNCKTRANDRGYNVIAMHNGNNNGSSCYIGKDLNAAKSNGIATKRKVVYNLLDNKDYVNKQIKGGLMKNGQIALGPTNLTPKKWKTTRFKANNDCDKELGAFINSQNTIANYGVNCNGKIKWR